MTLTKEPLLILKKRFSAETLTEEFRAVAFEKNEFEIRQSSKIDSFFGLSNYRTSNQRNGIMESLTQEPSNIITRSALTLMGEFKALIFEKEKFESQDMSTLTALLPLLATQNFNTGNKVLSRWQTKVYWSGHLGGMKPIALKEI